MNNNTSYKFIIRLITLTLIFAFILSIINAFNVLVINKDYTNLHAVAQQAAQEKHDKAMSNKTSKLYKYNSDEFIDDVITIATNEAKKGNFGIDLSKGFKVEDSKLVYTKDTDATDSDYYWPQEISEYIEDETIRKLELNGITTNADRPEEFKIRW